MEEQCFHQTAVCGSKNYPQVFLKKCKYVVKEKKACLIILLMI